MGAFLAEIIIAGAVFSGIYLLLRPLRRRIEDKLRRWLDRNPFPRKRRRPVINVYPIKPKKDEDQ
jgi:hypothetical protein